VNRVRRQLNLPETTPTGAGVRIAVLDSGIDAGHSDFQDRIDSASRSFSIVTDLIDRDGHGTHVAGIIGGSGAKSAGYYRGIAPEVTLIAYKIAGGRTGLEANAVAAIQAALDSGADIINYSHGFSPRARIGEPPWLWSDRYALIEDAFAVAETRGVLCVVAAGNEGPAAGSITRPGGLNEVLTVGAVGADGRVSERSSRGPHRTSKDLRPGAVERFDPMLHRDVKAVRKPDIVAPGGAVTAPRSSALRGGPDADLHDPDYITMSGTSQATAVVSGLAACILALARTHAIDLGPNQGLTLKRLIMHAARRLREGSVSDFGCGIPKWPMLQSTLSDFATDPQCRDAILADDLRLL
jgi:subtilisin family serine protease